jgi:hypothetical protein
VSDRLTFSVLQYGSKQLRPNKQTALKNNISELALHKGKHKKYFKQKGTKLLLAANCVVHHRVR